MARCLQEAVQGGWREIEVIDRVSLGDLELLKKLEP
jgi:hypothetical protein